MAREHVWECEYCGKTFDTKRECDKHEENCPSREKKTKFCPHCGKKISSEAEICPKCGVRVKEAPSYHEKKSSGMAAVLSAIIPGLGQIYNGQIGKGILFMILAGLLVVSFILFVGIVLYPLFWILNVYDAYKTAEKISAGGKK